ncbi:MAG: hypothetical protein K6G60_06880 [Lachnospiraceae bacterium]|nr:hypothetical protein [Lachnospiraceae bacterium]
MSKKSKTLTAAFLGLIIVITVAAFFYPKGNYSTSIDRIIEIENGVADAEPFGSILTVKSKGKYRFIADWWIGEKQVYKSPSFITGLIVTDETGEFKYPLAAGAIHIESGVMELEPGRYKVTFYVLPTQESYNDFCSANLENFNPSTTLAASFFTDGTWDMHYSFKIMADTSRFAAVSLIAGVAVGILLVVIVATLAIKSNAPVKKYDERQIAMQGKAYKYAFITMVIYFGLFAVVSTLSSLPTLFTLPFSADILVMLGVLTGAMVFAVTAIIHDAYFRLDENQGFIIILFVITSLINIAIGVVHIVNGDHAGDGVINMLNSGNLLCGAALLVLPISIMVKKLLDRNED